MPFEVNLTIRGLCAFVPSEPIRFDRLGKSDLPEQAIGNMKVLVMDARQPKLVSNGATPPSELEICAHLPLLRFSHPKKNMPRGFWLLDGHRLEISEVDTAQRLMIQPNFGESALMEEVVVLEDQVGPEQADVDRRFLESPFPLGPLVATMDLKAGRVEAIDLTGFWRFEPPPAPPKKTYEGFFRAAVRVTIPIKGTEALLRGIRQDGSNTFVQELRPKENGKPVDLLLSNLCLEDDAPTRRTVEGDFAVFYDLLPNYKGTLRVPHLDNKKKPNGAVPAEANNSPSCAVGVMRAAGG